MWWTVVTDLVVACFRCVLEEDVTETPTSLGLVVIYLNTMWLAVMESCD